MSKQIARSVWGLDVGKKKWACVKLWLDVQGKIEKVTGDPIPHLPCPELTDDCILAIADVPIGLLDDCKAKKSKRGGTVGRRPVDEGAKKWCLSHGSACDPPTILQYKSGLLEHARAAAAAKSDKRRKLGNVLPKGLSCQSLEMIPAIQSAEKVKEKYPEKLYESHPEVAFAAVASGILPFNKKSLTGSLARAIHLGRRLKMDCVRWVIRQEGRTTIKADDWHDALVMALVAYDWQVKEDRWILSGENGNPQEWNGERDRMMALPLTALRQAPEELCKKDVSKMVLARQRRVRIRDK